MTNSKVRGEVVRLSSGEYRVPVTLKYVMSTDAERMPVLITDLPDEDIIKIGQAWTAEKLKEAQGRRKAR